MDVREVVGEALDPLRDVAVGVVVSGVEHQFKIVRPIVEPLADLLGLLDVGAGVMMENGNDAGVVRGRTDLVDPPPERLIVNDAPRRGENAEELRAEGGRRFGPLGRVLYVLLVVQSTGHHAVELEVVLLKAVLERVGADSVDLREPDLDAVVPTGGSSRLRGDGFGVQRVLDAMHMSSETGQWTSL